MRVLLMSIAAMLIAAAILTAGEYFSVRRYGFEADSLTNGVPRIVILTIATYVGIAGQIVTSRLKRSEEDKVAILSELRDAMQSREFWIAILASPFVLFAAYSAIEQVTSLALVGAIAFQNGFFFHSILSRPHPLSGTK